jgi:hypothetical protein
VAYTETKRITTTALGEAVHAGEASPRQPVRQDVLARLRRGLLTSPRTPNAIVRMAREEFGAEEE